MAYNSACVRSAGKWRRVSSVMLLCIGMAFEPFLFHPGGVQHALNSTQLVKSSFFFLTGKEKSELSLLPELFRWLLLWCTFARIGFSAQIYPGP